MDATSWRIAWLQQDLLTTLPSTPIIGTPTTATYTQSGVVSYTVDFFDKSESYSNAVLGNNLHIGGGVLTVYDGTSPVEHGTHVYPELASANVSLDPLGGGGIGIPGTGSATYWYVATYEWTDSQGQVHRSAPSIPVSVITLTGNTTTTATVTLPTLRLTRKQTSRTPVTINVYRTIANGTVFYSCNSSIIPAASGAANRPIINSTTVDSVTFVDVLSDALIIGNPTLYTTGNVLENTPTPPMSSMTVFKNRIIGIDSTNPLSLWYSKEVMPGSPVEFSDFLTLNVDPRGGPVMALATLDDKLIIFKASSIVSVQGV